jgi:hypothetical protein
MPVVECPAGSRFSGVGGRADESSPAPVLARTGPPNVVLVVLDDRGPGQLGCPGDRRAPVLPHNHRGRGLGLRHGLWILVDGVARRWHARPAVDPDGRRPMSSWTGTKKSRLIQGGQR